MEPLHRHFLKLVRNWTQGLGTSGLGSAPDNPSCSKQRLERTPPLAKPQPKQMPGKSSSEKSNPDATVRWGFWSDPASMAEWGLRSTTKTAEPGWHGRIQGSSIASSSTHPTGLMQMNSETQVEKGQELSTDIPTVWAMWCSLCGLCCLCYSQFPSPRRICACGATLTALEPSAVSRLKQAIGLTEPLSSTSSEKAGESPGQSMDPADATNWYSMLSRGRNLLQQSIGMFSRARSSETLTDMELQNLLKLIRTCSAALVDLEIMYWTALQERAQYWLPQLRSSLEQQLSRSIPPTTGNASGDSKCCPER